MQFQLYKCIMEKKWKIILPSYSLLQAVAGVMCVYFCALYFKRERVQLEIPTESSGIDQESRKREL